MAANEGYRDRRQLQHQRSTIWRLCQSARKRGSSLFGGFRSSAFGLVCTLAGDASRGSSLLFGISSSAVPAWDQGNGADQSDSRPDHHMECDRHKSPSELVPSIVPRGTSIRRRRNSSFGVADRGFPCSVRCWPATSLSSSGILYRRSTCDA